MTSEQKDGSPERRERDRSPVRSSHDRNDDDNKSDGSTSEKDHHRDRDNDRNRRGERSGRLGARNTSKTRDQGGKKGASDRRVFVSNVAYELGWQEVKDIFKQEVGNVAYVDLFTDENDKPRGCGIIEFDNPESVKRAIEKMHRYELKGRKLVVKEDFDVDRDKHGRPQKSGGRGSGGNRMRDEPRSHWDQPSFSHQTNMSLMGQAAATLKAANTYGLSPQFLENLGITGPLLTRVFVANLHYKVDEKKLKEVFRLAGKVVNIELSLDKEGDSRGFGVVEFDHPVEAVQAISMFNNQSLYDRKMTVRMDRVDHKNDGPLKLPEGLRSIGMGLGAGGNPLQDIARSLPTGGCLSSALVGDLPAAAAPGLGLGHSGAAFQAGLAGVAGLGAAGLMGGGGTDLGLGHGHGAVGGSVLGGSLGTGASGLGAANLGGGAAIPYGGSSQAALGGAFGGGVRDFDSLSAALAERDYRGSSVPGSNYSANGPNRGLGLSAGVAGRKSDTIVVKNLPPSITWQLLRDKFRDVGDVTFAEMRGKDIGLIRFRSEWDAERAVHMMDRTRIDGRTIEVSLF